MKELIAVSQKNKPNCTLCSILRFTGNFTFETYWKISTSDNFHF